MQLRILSTVNDVSQSNTIIIAFTLEILKAIGVQGVVSLSAIGSKKNSG
jgi:purine nucleoside phosphorylase